MACGVRSKVKTRLINRENFFRKLSATSALSFICSQDKSNRKLMQIKCHAEHRMAMNLPDMKLEGNLG